MVRVRAIGLSLGLSLGLVSDGDIDRIGLGRGGKKKTRAVISNKPRPTHLPRPNLNRKFYFLSGLFLVSNIFIQIPAKP